jgi:hypothetical protein
MRRVSTAPFAPTPAPPSERNAWIIACVLCVLGACALVAALTGLVGSTTSAVAPPPVLVRAATPAAGSSTATATGTAAGVNASAHARARRSGAIVAQPTPAQQRAQARLLLDPTQVHISRRWMEGFYPIYATAQSTFGVNWLLIASIHRQESAFSTARGTYDGLNYAGCCGGPMQFNVRNGGPGIPSTWDLVADSYIYGKRPAHYDHMTVTHPSIYDDFDAIMAAAHLLSADGAEYALNDSAWWAAYDYYGHDATGVSYADEVLARAISWSQHGFCINCGVEAPMVQAVYAAYGAPVLAELEAEEKAQTQMKARLTSRRPA